MARPLRVEYEGAFHHVILRNPHDKPPGERRKGRSFLLPKITPMKCSNKRDLAIYLMKRYTGSTNGQIGEMFGISFSAVTKAAERISSRLEMEKDLRRKVGKITDCFKG